MLAVIYLTYELKGNNNRQSYALSILSDSVNRDEVPVTNVRFAADIRKPRSAS